MKNFTSTTLYIKVKKSIIILFIGFCLPAVLHAQNTAVTVSGNVKENFHWMVNNIRLH